jgi:molybdenum cofactor cytidylyltransferase
MSIGIVILAAGESARMGEPKQLLAYRGKTLLRHSLDAALSVPDAPVVVVLGANADLIHGQIDAARVIITQNEDWREGMGGSLSVGLKALLAQHDHLTAALFLVCDQPLLSADLLKLLIAKHEETGREIVAAEYDGALAVPALFGRSLFPELLALKGASGARKVIQTHRSLAIGVPFPGGEFDIDTPSDYERLCAARAELTAPVLV